MSVDSAALRTLLHRRGVAAGTDDDALVALAAEPAHKLAATLLSAWAAEGRPLSTAHRELLDGHRRRVEHYQRVWAAVSGDAPAAYVVKGPGIAAHYPPGLLRSAGDLDVVCRDRDQLWHAATRLVEQGWEVGAVTVQQAGAADGEAYDVLMQLEKRIEDAPAVPYMVDLTSAEVATSMRERARRLAAAQSSALATSAIALVAERWERRFTSRDVLDLHLLEGAATARDAAVLRDGLAQTGLRGAWRELARAVDGSGLAAGPAPRDRFDPGPAVRLPRLLDRARRWAHPVRALGYLAGSTVDTDRGPLVDRIGQLAHRAGGARRLLSLGLPLFGVPMGGDSAGGRMRLADQGGQLVAHTPVGSFLLVGSACRPEWLDQAAAPGPWREVAA